MSLHVSNRFDYFAEIEALFVRRRGKHLWLSPNDWALIQSWKERGIPLHVALRGIERVFDLHEATRRKRRDINSLSYCQGEVEAQFSEWLEKQIGADSRATAKEADRQSSEDELLPFPRISILAHLEECRLVLTALSTKKGGYGASFCNAVGKVAGRLQELKEDFARAEEPNAERLEQELGGLENYLSEHLLSLLSPEQLSKERSEVGGMVSSYRSRTRRDVYESMINELVMKRLREAHGIPRLSLFHL